MLFESIDIGRISNRAYLIGDEKTREVVIIDAGYKHRRILERVQELESTVKYVLATHSHRDHYGSASAICSSTDAPFLAFPSSNWKGITLSRSLSDGAELVVGNVQITVLHTPGHTSDSVCFLVNKSKLLVGDTLFVGRVPRSSPDTRKQMRIFYDTLHERVMALEDHVEVWPGHNVGEKSSSTIGKERRTNYVLNMDFDDFFRRKWDETERRWIVPSR